MSTSAGFGTEELEHVAAWERQEEFLRSEVPGLLCGRPAVRRIAALAEDVWEIEDEWWRQHPISRRYYRVLLEDGSSMTLFRDLLNSLWYEQKT